MNDFERWAGGLTQLLAINASMTQSLEACQKEGMTTQQRACVGSAKSINDLSNCEALRTNPLGWLKLPPKGVEIPRKPSPPKGAAQGSPEAKQLCEKMAEHLKVLLPSGNEDARNWLVEQAKPGFTRSCVVSMKPTENKKNVDCFLSSKSLADLQNCRK